ncbi:MAG: sarcosine oxidase subunit delta [Kiritimatiellae bacterium]|nr:sarcosine oxidase subunit delta [Kiritimatiellia bacterium]
MSFMLRCPNCGDRHVAEFSFRGEYLQRPQQEDEFASWADYVYMKENVQGKHFEWWYHGSGCQRWFLAERDTTDNTTQTTFWFDDRPRLINRESEPDA